MKPTRIFISSTWEDLQPEREAVEKALHRMRDTAFAGMEYFGSRPETPKEVSLAEVDRSDVYIGIFAHRYGSGITEAEYRRARERDIPCLIYLKDDSVPVPPAYIERDPEKIVKLEHLKRELKAHHTVSFFESPHNLATQVVTDLHNLLRSAHTVREEEPSQLGPKYQITITDSQGVVIGDQAQVVQQFGTPAPFHLSSEYEELRDKILRIIYDHESTGTAELIGASQIAEQLGLTTAEIDEQLEILEWDRYAKLAKAGPGNHGARLTPLGKQRVKEGLKPRVATPHLRQMDA